MYNWEGPTFQGLSPRAMLDPLILLFPWLEKSDILLVQHKGFIPTKGLRCESANEVRRTWWEESSENKPWIFQFGCDFWTLRKRCIGTPYHPWPAPLGRFRNLFVLYFGGWTLQDKDFFPIKTMVIWVPGTSTSIFQGVQSDHKGWWNDTL